MADELFEELKKRHGFQVDQSDQDAYAQGRLNEDDIRGRMEKRGYSTGGGQESPTNSWNSMPQTATAQPAQGTQTPGWNPHATSGSFYDEIMKRAQQGDVTADDPYIKAQTDAYGAEQTRASRGFLDDLAEKGGATANLLGEQRLAAERVGQNVGGFRAELMGREQGARRQQIMQALQMWGNQMSEDQRMQLQQELARMSDATQRYGIDTGKDLSLRDLALREWGMGQDNDYRWATL